MNTFRVRELRVFAILLFAGLSSVVPRSARGQAITVAETGTRYAGNASGTNIFSGDTGTSTTTSLNGPSYVVFDAGANLFVADTLNNCVRKIDIAGNVTTVAGLRVNGGPDTCNTTSNPTPTAAQGLYKPTGLAIDGAGTLYIADSLHNCVRTLASGAVDSFAANALGTAAGTCTNVDTSSVTPVPNGLAIDASGALYISIQDTAAATPVNQVLRHAAADPATTVCLIAGQSSANVSNVCAGVTGSVTLSSPAGLAFDVLGDLFIADTGNNCVREAVGLTTLGTAVGQCTNDSTGTSATALQNPYGLAFSPAQTLYISEAAASFNAVMNFVPATGTLTQVAGLLTGASGPYGSAEDGQPALNNALNGPLGLVTSATGNVYMADSGNNVIRRLSTEAMLFGFASVGSTGATETISFAINQPVNLSAAIGADYTIATNTCAGALTPPTTCQVTVTFAPTRPGARNSALRLTNTTTGTVYSTGLYGTGVGSLSLLAPGTASSLAKNLRSPITVSVDSSGNAYVLEQGDAATTADVIMIPAGGGPVQTVVPQGVGLMTPTAMAVDAAGNIFIAEATTNGITRIGADGSVNTSYATGLPSVTALAVDTNDNLYVAQAGSVHDVIEVYAGGAQLVIAGSGTTPSANGIAAVNAQFVAPSSLALGPNGLSIADASGHLVYTVDATGTIHLIAGNGTTITSDATQATGTALLNPVGLAVDAAGDVYISDEAANRVYEVFPIESAGSNISTALGSGVTGNTGDGGPATVATLNAPLAIALDGSSDLFAVDSGNSAVREAMYTNTRLIDFGNVTIGTPSTIAQTIVNAGNLGLTLTTPFTTNNPVITTTGAATTCTGSLGAGGQCNIGYTFNPTVLGSVGGQSIITSSAYDSPQEIDFKGFGLVTQNLPFTLTPETEVYGQPFTQTATITLVPPDLTPTGSMVFSISGETTCSAAGPFGATVNCPAPESGLSVGLYSVNFAYNSGDASYFSTTSTTTLLITPAPLTVTPTNEIKAFGAPIPALPGTIVGMVNGDLFLLSDTTTATAASPVGTYPITGTLTAVGLAQLSNYTVTYNIGTLTVGTTPLTVTVTNATRPYGAANPAFASTIVGAANGDTFTVTYATTATSTSPVGTYPITATISGADMPNYSVTIVAGTLTVTPIALTVNVASTSRPYGTSNPSFTSTILGAINGDTFTQNLTTTATIGSPVGTYPINDVLSGPAAANYTITVNPGTLTITPATVVLNVTANNATRAYGAANPTFTSTISGALNGDTFTITYATTATVTSAVGTYPIVPTVSGAAAANYTVVTNNGLLTVTQAAASVTVNGATRLYGAANPAFASTVVGLLNGDTLTITYATTATVTSPVGPYPIVPTISGAAAANYTITPANGTLTVTQAPLAVTANNATRAYSVANPVFSGTTSGLLNGDTVNVTYATTATIASPVGTYPITPSVTGAALSNYSLTTNNGTLTITQTTTSPLAVAVNNLSRAYGAANPGFTDTITGLLNGDTVTVSFSTTATATSPVGTYPITATISGAAVANYSTVNVVAGTLTVTPAALIVAGNNATRAYGVANPAFAGTTTGLANGDTVNITYATTATVASPVGTYPIVPTVTGAALSNYTLTTNNGTLTVSPSATNPLTVTVNSVSRAYGTANPTLTGTVSGLLNGDTVTVTYATTATAASAAGGYPITATVTGAAAANYVINVAPGTLTVTPAVLNVTANNATRAYGAANPTFTSTVSGALNGDTFTITYATTATVTSPVGTYPIVPTVTGVAAANYTITTNPGTLTITPATAVLTVSANNATRVYGAANPTFTGTTTGLLNGDTVNVTYATTATVASPVGTYPIVPTVTGAALSNYTLVTANGTLTITASTSPLTVTVNSFTKAYGAANPTLTGTVAGLLNGDTVTVAYTTTATTTSDVGTYPITATVTGAAAANYTLNIVPGTLTVTQVATTLALQTSASPVFYGTAVTFTATVSSTGGTPAGTVTFTNGTATLGTGTLNASGVATFTTSTLAPGSQGITATYPGTIDFGSSSASITQVINAGSFALTATPADQFVRGAGSSIYTITATSAQGFTGPVTLTCAGMPSDGTCTFANATLTLNANGTASTTMTVTNTSADAKLRVPAKPGQPKDAARFAPIAFAAVFPFELTGLGVLFAGVVGRRRRKQITRSPKMRLLLVLLCTAGLMGLAGCACFTSVYKNYTVTVTGSTTVPGVASQTTSVMLSVGQQ